MRTQLTLGIAVALSLLAGCDSDLPQATEIVHMRVLGARLGVVGDEERTTPKPGETLRVSLPVVFPELDADRSQLETLIIGCTGPDRYTGGLPLCQEFIDAALSGQSVTGVLPASTALDCDGINKLANANLNQRDALSVQCVNGDPSFELEVQDDYSAEKLLFLGVVCERGRAQIDPTDPLLFGCRDSDGGQAIRFHGLTNVEQAPEDVNYNPSLTPFSILREGVEWLEYDYDEPPPERGCQSFKPFREEEVGNRDPNAAEAAEADRDKRWHSVVAGAHRIVLRYQADAREEFEGEPENLQFTVYTTVGEMERRFTVFAPEDESPNGVFESELDWDPPSPTDVPKGGELVRFFITLRDQRGGFAMTERVLCLR